MPDLGCRQDADAPFFFFFFRCLIGFRFDGISYYCIVYVIIECAFVGRMDSGLLILSVGGIDP